MRKYIILGLCFSFFTAPLCALDKTELRHLISAHQPYNAQFDEMMTKMPSEQQSFVINLLAGYLFNMYMLQDSVPADKELSLNYLGALDILDNLKRPLLPKEINSLYQTNREKIQQEIAVLSQWHNLPYIKDEAQEEKWIAWLQESFTLPFNRTKPLYTIPDTLTLKDEFARAHVTEWLPFVSRALAVANRKAVLYETPQVSWEDLDTRLIRGVSGSVEYTYRWVKDECEYTSYVLGAALLEAAKENPQKWGKTRLYKITARPAGNLYYLQPSNGERFTLADGSASAKWHYHTALLAVFNVKEGQYVPVVFENFLASAENPIKLSQWLQFFDKTTRIEVVPFARNEKVEKFIQEPQQVKDGGDIYYNGHYYKPAPIEK